jgi:hypothetical protein
MTMKIYWTHPDTREFTSVGHANESPLEPGVFAIPADATTVEPPEPEQGHARVFKDGAWAQVPDHRGETWWTEEGVEVVIYELGEPPEGWSNEPPPPSPPPPSPIPMTPEQRLEALGLSLADLRQLLGLGK